MENAEKIEVNDDVAKAEAAQREREARQEAIVICAREKILPVLNEQNPCVNDAKLICDTLAVAIMQGQYELLKKHKVSDLKLLDLIKEGYPGYKTVVSIIEKINDESMELGINTLQWMVEKIKKMLEDENKDRKFEDLKLDF